MRSALHLETQVRPGLASCTHGDREAKSCRTPASSSREAPSCRAAPFSQATEPTAVPPLTSSCGGKGPFDAQTWAARKGYHDVEQAIVAAYHLRKFYEAVRDPGSWKDGSAAGSAGCSVGRSGGEARVTGLVVRAALHHRQAAMLADPVLIHIFDDALQDSVAAHALGNSKDNDRNAERILDEWVACCGSARE